MKERDIQLKFKKYIESVRNSGNFAMESFACELKLVTGKRMMINSSNPKSNAVKNHQLQALMNVAHNGLFYKIQDEPFRGEFDSNRFHLPKPFDCFFLKTPLAFVGVCFYKKHVKGQKRKPLELICIDVDTFSRLKKFSGKKSLTEKELRPYATQIIELKSKYPQAMNA